METTTVRNKRTGEIRIVPNDQLDKFGITGTASTPTPTLTPTPTQTFNQPQGNMSFLDKLTETDLLPNIGQVAGNIGGLPFQKKGRIGIGTASRMLGEILKQEIGNVRDPQSLIGRPRSQTVGEVGSVLKQGGIGLGTEITGEMLAGLLSKIGSAVLKKPLMGVRDIVAKNVQDVVPTEDLALRLLSDLPENAPLGKLGPFTTGAERVASEITDKGEYLSIQQLLDQASKLNTVFDKSGTLKASTQKQIDAQTRKILTDVIGEVSPPVSSLNKAISGGIQTENVAKSTVKRFLPFLLLKNLLGGSQ